MSETTVLDLASDFGGRLLAGRTVFELLVLYCTSTVR
jgi:hypothetical protein